MTTTQHYTNPSLSVDLHEDHMEMAISPYPQTHDDDIDFELDDNQEPSIEDNSMIDDAGDNMEDIPTQDDMMFDEQDNDLIDYDEDLPMDPEEASYASEHDIDDELDNSTHHSHVDQSISQHNVDEIATTTAFTEDVTATDGQTNEYYPEEEETNIESNTNTDQHDNTNTVHGGPVYPQDTNEISQEHLEAVEQTSPNTGTTAVVDFAEKANAPSVNENELDQPQIDNADYPAQLVETDEFSNVKLNASKSIEAFENALHKPEAESNEEFAPEALEDDETHESPHRESSPEVLHPVAVRYNDEDCWLFPPLDTSDVRHIFLQDATLASQPFDKLLAAIRPGLIDNQNMADHDEIVFDIPALGLHICEDSKHASLVTLSRVIDMYMMLSQNEGLTEFEPLYCELSTRVCLADQYAYLDDAAFSRRITYTEFVTEQASTPEDSSHVNQNDEEVDETQVDITTYLDASNDPTDEEQPATTSVEAGQPDSESTDDIESADAVPGTNDDVEIRQVNSENEDQDSTAPNGTAPPEALTQDLSIDEPVVVDDVEDALQEEIHELAGDDEEYSPEYLEETTTDLPQDLVKFNEAEIALEIEEEDLFAEDDETLKLPNPNSEQTSLVRDEESKVKNEVATTHEDDLDFDNWSDDETENQDVESIPKSLTTPSKTLNGKRKLIDDDDDFLEIDVSTPEPKRTRAS